MKSTKKWVEFLTDITYMVSMAVLGYFSIRGETFVLPLYQIDVTIYIISGVAKYRISKGLTAELKSDMFKDFITAILTVAVLMSISNSFDYNAIDSAISIFVHNIMLLTIFGLIKCKEKSCGVIAYFTYPAAFLIALVMIKARIPIVISMAIGVVIVEPLNYLGCKYGNNAKYTEVNQMQKKSTVTIIVVALCFVVVVPFLLEFLVFRNNIFSVLSNGEWGGFLGSYIGGALGGIGTLLAVYITTKETRKIQKDTLQRMEQDRETNMRNERKRFTDEIAETIAKYIAEISVYFYGCRALERLDNDKRDAKKELSLIESEIQRLYSLEQQNDDISHIEVEINQLKQKESMQKSKIENIEKDIAIHRVNRIVANECYFLLQMKLQSMDEWQLLIEQLKYIHTNSASVDSIPFEWIDKETKKLQNIAVILIERYVE